MRTQNVFFPIVQSYFEKDPVSAAHSLEVMAEEEALEAVKQLPPDLAAESVKYLDDNPLS